MFRRAWTTAPNVRRLSEDSGSPPLPVPGPFMLSATIGNLPSTRPVAHIEPIHGYGPSHVLSIR